MRCPRCQYDNEPEAFSCNLCGEVLNREESVPPPPIMGEDGDNFDSFRETHVGPVPWVDREEDPEPGSEIDTILPSFPLSADVGFCLICHPLDPIPLDRECALTFGRARSNDVIFPVSDVSREHAEFSWEGDTFAVRGMDSANGTFVNKVRVHKRGLKDGDVVQIGPYELKFRAYRGSLEDLHLAPREETEGTRYMDREKLLGKSSTFSGKIGEVRMDEVIQLIDFNKKTGVLEIEAESRLGEFHFDRGQILHAEFHHTQGLVAMARALSLKDGKFYFRAGKHDCEQTLFDPTATILFNATKRLDELDK
ncbi:MAG: FHA domain-containing protein [Planctomycetota bacterium]|jgi:pSer/pThr/pTyr-binding forkhead associated (FHA) protein